jgi:hypothetical protein
MNDMARFCGAPGTIAGLLAQWMAPHALMRGKTYHGMALIDSELLFDTWICSGRNWLPDRRVAGLFWQTSLTFF